MYLNKYFYEYATEDVGDRVGIKWIDREDYMTSQYMSKYKEQLDSIKLDGKVGVVYSSGASIHQAENRICSRANYTNSLGSMKSPIVAKSMVAYMQHKYIGLFGKNGNNICDADIVSNTCASSIYGVIRAEEMLKYCDHVIVITEEKTSFDTIRIFNEHRIDLKASDGYAVAVFSRTPTSGSSVEITDCKKAFMYNPNPFFVSEAGYMLVDTESDVVKVHGTGTSVNDTAEANVFGSRKCIEYKSKIGHAQGSSGLVEMCMAIDDENASGKVLCVSSGFGGYYGSVLVHKG